MAVERRKSIRYRVLITPKATTDTYGTEVDVSDNIDVSGVKSIRRSIDAGDYQIGVFTTDDITITGYNFNGIFNDQNDSRSMFPAGRDLAKVRVQFIEFDDEGEETATIAFRGLINEEATRLDIKKDTIKFRVLSNDSVIRNTKVPAGVVSAGTLYSAALLAILNQVRITDILTVSSANINVDLDLAVDVGSVFDDRPTKDALNDLLLASNSVMIIDSSDNVIIKARTEDTTTDVVNLYGKSDIFARENIIDIGKYNSGRHRMFTSVTVNDQERSNTAFEAEFGTRNKAITFDFMTTDTKEIDIADRLIDEFKTPKIEVEVTVRTSDVKGCELLDRVSVNYPLRLALPTGAEFLPVIDVTTVNDATEPLPRQFGSLAIASRVGFKIIEMRENPKDFTSKLKLRQFGKDLGDGFFDSPGSCLVGFAVIDECDLPSGGDACATWNPSILGAALIDCTEIA